MRLVGIPMMNLPSENDSRRDTWPEPPLLLSTVEAAALLGINRSTVFELLASGDITSVKIGRRRLISRQALAEFIAAREGRA